MYEPSSEIKQLLRTGGDRLLSNQQITLQDFNERLFSQYNKPPKIIEHIKK